MFNPFRPTVAAVAATPAISGKETIECLDPTKASPGGEPNSSVTSKQIAQLAVMASCTVAQLPAASASNKGVAGSVTDATQTWASASVGVVVTGSGSNFVPVMSDGTNWRVC